MFNDVENTIKLKSKTKLKKTVVGSQFPFRISQYFKYAVVSF